MNVIEEFNEWFDKKYKTTQHKKFAKELFWAFNAGYDARQKEIDEYEDKIKESKQIIKNIIIATKHLGPCPGTIEEANEFLKKS